jgi:hypothetical protein
MSKKMSGKSITVPLARRILGMPGHASSAFNRCIGNELRGVHAPDRAAAMKNFSSAASKCKGKRG